MLNTDQLIDSLREQLISGQDSDGLFDQLDRSVNRLAEGLASADVGVAAETRVRAEMLQAKIVELTTLLESRLGQLNSELTVMIRQNNLQRRYGLTPH